MSDHGIGGFPDGAGCSGGCAGRPLSKLRLSRLYYFLTFAMLGTFWTLLATFGRYLGLSATQAGIISGARPLVGGIAVAGWTHLADRYQTLKKPILLMSVTSHAVTALLLVFFEPQFGQVQSRVCPAPAIGTNNSYRNSSAAAVQVGRDATFPTSAVLQLSNFSGRSVGHAGNHSSCHLENFTSSVPTSNTYGTLELSLSTTFVALLSLVLLNDMIGASITTMADVATYSHLGDSKYTNFGWIRVWGSGGWSMGVFFLMLASEYFHRASHGKSHTTAPAISNSTDAKYLSGNYHIVFGTLAAVLTLSFMTGALFQFKQHASSVTRNALAKTARQVLTPKMTVFSAVVLYCGMVIGLVLSFLLWRIQDLGGKQSIMGVASLLLAVSDIPAYLLAPPLIRHITGERVILLSLVCQCLYLLGMGLAAVPWVVVLLQPLVGAFHGLMWAAVQSVFVPLSQPGTESLMLGILHTLVYGVGVGVGSFVGGVLVDAYGSNWTFIYASIGSVCALCVYSVSLWYFGDNGIALHRQNGFMPMTKSNVIGDTTEDSDGDEEASFFEPKSMNEPLANLKRDTAMPSK